MQDVVSLAKVLKCRGQRLFIQMGITFPSAKGMECIKRDEMEVRILSIVSLPVNTRAKTSCEWGLDASYFSLPKELRSSCTNQVRTNMMVSLRDLSLYSVTVGDLIM